MRVTGVNFSDGIGTVEIELPENHAILRAIAQIEDASTVSLAACTAITSSNSVRLRCFLANSGEGYTGNTVGYINILICVGVISD